MGAPNFANSGLSKKVYPIGMPYECEETGETIYPDDIMEDIDNYFAPEAKELLKAYKPASLWEGSKARQLPSEHDRQYNTKCFLEAIFYSDYGSINVEASLVFFVQNAYHEGAQLDYQVMVSIKEHSYDDGEIPDELPRYMYLYENEGLHKLHESRVLERAGQLFEKVESIADKILDTLYPESYTVVATASNGEQLLKQSVNA